MSFENPLGSFFPEKKKEKLSREEVMRCIEELPVDDGIKADILLVAEGFKRCAADLEVSLMESNGTEQISQEEAARRLSRFESIIEKLGLFSVPGERVLLDDGYAFQTYVVGTSLEEAAELGQIWEDASLDTISLGEKRALEQRKGELLGFPKTAVDAFVNSIMLDMKLSAETKLMTSRFQIPTEELPADIQKQDYMSFLGFILSREHWREELKTVEDWASAVKESDPALYQRITKGQKLGDIPAEQH